MKLEEVLVRRLAAEINDELDALDALVQELAHAPQSDDSYARRARGSILHDFYNGVERVFERVACELNGGVPKAEQWHREPSAGEREGLAPRMKELLDNMALGIPEVRPPLIDQPLAATLHEYRRFRHLFRNVYGTVLETGRMRILEERLPDTLAAFRRQVSAFLRWMVGGGEG